MTRVLLVEDEAWVREDVAALLGSGSATVVAAAASCREAREAIDHGPEFDVALIDLGLPDGSGVELIARVRARRPDAAPIAFTVHADPPSVFAAIEAGARGYVLKSTPADRLIPALEAAAAGGAPLSPAVARLIVDRFTAGRVDEGPPPAALTARETEVLGLLAKGLSYAQVGTALDVALGTVQAHVRNIYGKLEISSKAEAAVVAAKLGLV